ncbi:MAG: CBS domain-containing protein [Deltaproteobacteria bacterium]|nr:CBS domain-containing protein [Deltaproteobacteria bacterium]
MKVSSFMTACPYKISSERSIDEALQLMKLRDIRHLPVVREGGSNSNEPDDLLGVVSKRDVELSKYVCQTTNYCPSIGDICVSDPFVTQQDTAVSEVAQQMALQKLDYALVVDDAGHMVGIFTTTDACRALTLVLGEEQSGGGAA